MLDRFRQDYEHYMEERGPNVSKVRCPNFETQIRLDALENSGKLSMPFCVRKTGTLRHEQSNKLLWHTDICEVWLLGRVAK